MNNFKIIFAICLLAKGVLFAQVGIGTTNPKGQLDVTSSNLGIVLPRVTRVEDVTDGSGNEAVNGTIVFDLSRQKLCYRSASKWLCIGLNGLGNSTTEIIGGFSDDNYTYVKASNSGAFDGFGYRVSIDDDGNTMAVSTITEESIATGINGNQADDSGVFCGAVYVFVRYVDTWVQQAYIKASNTESFDLFGASISLSGDGNTLAVGALGESSNATGINGNQTDNSSGSSGAVYIYTRTGSTWTQAAYVKPSNTDTGDGFGSSVSLNGLGDMLVVGAPDESSNATGVNGNQADNSVTSSGAVYVFYKTSGVWTQEVYLKPPITEAEDNFGSSVCLSSDASTLAVAVLGEDSSSTGINGNQADNSASNSGAVYVFKNDGSGFTATPEAYIKASNTDANDNFGVSLSLSADGNVLAIGAAGSSLGEGEDSRAVGVNGDTFDNTSIDSGAVYLFSRTGSIWTQDAYLKPSNTDASDSFGWSVSLDYWGTSLVVGSFKEDAAVTGVGGNHLDNGATDSGAVYLFINSGSNWTQDAYIKASNTGADDRFGFSVSLSGDGSTLVVGATGEDSVATEINGIQTDNTLGNSGAVYILETD